MLENQLFEIVKEKYKSKDKLYRLKHVEGVYFLAKKLASIYNLPLEKITYASILHDISKFETKEYMISLINDNDIINNYPFETWHAFAGANYVKKILKIQDEDIINAIRYHVFGRFNMTLLEKIIMLSDFCEETRTFDEANIVRKILLEEKNLDKALYFYYYYLIKHLEEDNKNVLDIQYKLKDYYKEKIC